MRVQGLGFKVLGARVDVFGRQGTVRAFFDAFEGPFNEVGMLPASE